MHSLQNILSIKYIHSIYIILYNTRHIKQKRKPQAGIGQSSNAKSRKFMGQKKDIYEPETPGGIRRTEEGKLERKKQYVIYIYVEKKKVEKFSQAHSRRKCALFLDGRYNIRRPKTNSMKGRPTYFIYLIGECGS